MKIAWINHSIGLRETAFKFGLEAKGIELFFSKTPEQFQEKYGSIDNYDGLALHLDPLEIARCLKIFEYAKTKPVILLTNCGGDIKDAFPIFPYSNVDAIAKYFLERQK